MTVISNNAFAKKMIGLARPAIAFRPEAHYDPDCDCIEFLVSPEAFYGERVDELVTVYYGQESRQIVGALIKGASKFCKRLLDKLPGFVIEIRDGRVRLACVFRARLWSLENTSDEMLVITYRKLITIAEQSQAEVELCASPVG